MILHINKYLSLINSYKYLLEILITETWSTCLFVCERVFTEIILINILSDLTNKMTINVALMFYPTAGFSFTLKNGIFITNCMIAD